MHNNKSICQDGFEEVYAANMTKPRIKVLKKRERPGRKRMSDKSVIQAEKTPVALPPAGTVDIERFSKNVARMVEEGGKALAAYLKPREDGAVKIEPADEIADVVKTLGHVAEYWLSDPQRAVEVQATLGKAYLDLWA
jgi:hypothetical protein